LSFTANILKFLEQVNLGVEGSHGVW
jgi:hypothetical protein